VLLRVGEGVVPRAAPRVFEGGGVNALEGGWGRNTVKTLTVEKYGGSLPPPHPQLVWSRRPWVVGGNRDKSYQASIVVHASCNVVGPDYSSPSRVH